MAAKPSASDDDLSETRSALLDARDRTKRSGQALIFETQTVTPRARGWGLWPRSLAKRLRGHIQRLGPLFEQRLEYRAGQYVTLVRPDGLTRSYSIASQSASNRDCLELHVRIFPNGQMSSWLSSHRALRTEVAIRGPLGDCFYVPGNPAQPLLLVGTGTGLAPLWGILNDALESGHSGPIELWHGARTAAGLYLVRELETLASTHRQFTYRRSILQGPADACIEVGDLDAALLGSATSFEGRRVFLCGDPNLVRQVKRKVFLKGASMREIHADAFVGSAT